MDRRLKSLAHEDALVRLGVKRLPDDDGETLAVALRRHADGDSGALELVHDILAPPLRSYFGRETRVWKKLVPTFTSGVLYLFDLGFFERALFASARAAGAHVLMRLKTTAKVRVLSHASANGRAPLPGWSLGYYLQVVSKKRGTVFDLDVSWGKGKDLIALRLVGFAHKANSIRWYLTTVPRSMLTANQVIQTYRLRWLIGASSQGRITQSVKVRPRPNDSRSRSVGGTVAREQDGEALRQSLGRRSAKLQVAA